MTRRWPGSPGSSTPPTSPRTWIRIRSARACWRSAPAAWTWKPTTRQCWPAGRSSTTPSMPPAPPTSTLPRRARAPGRAAGMPEPPAPAPQQGTPAPQDATQAPREGADAGQPSEPETARPPGFGSFVRYFLGLGTWGFGGPIATVGYMQRDLVERRNWMTRADFLDGVALGQAMPGPLAAQVAMWVGFL